MSKINSLLIIGSSAFALLACSAGKTMSSDQGATPWFTEPAQKAEVVNLELPRTIRVALLQSRSTILIGGTGGFTYQDEKNGKTHTAANKAILKVKSVKGGMSVGSKKFTSNVKVIANPGTYLSVNKRAYRGKFILRRKSNGTVDVIEEVPLEDYLYGVLPREVGAEWPVESLKAQAVISRTYVLANLGKSGSKGYDVTATVSSQVYGGLKDEHTATNQAVDITRGEILVDTKGQPVLTFFHSSCGGRTENPRYVWRDLPNPPSYLDSVRDTFCRGDPFYDWDLDINADRLQRRLRHAGYKVGKIKKLSIAKTSPSGRAWSFAVDSDRGQTVIPGNSFRLAVGPEALRSTLIETIRKKGSVFHIEGHGWGHGVGMCQWGARGRAMEGHDYLKILEAYYPDVRLVKAGGSQ